MNRAPCWYLGQKVRPIPPLPPVGGFGCRRPPLAARYVESPHAPAGFQPVNLKPAQAVSTGNAGFQLDALLVTTEPESVISQVFKHSFSKPYPTLVSDCPCRRTTDCSDPNDRGSRQGCYMDR
ncbi:MAG: hypothetical protein Ct9H300mP14_04480 [Gammaproteobacteria bacterium]|nr:MAG: hypothetical protein Ct9H300mP14_04480 [Gammaproteobacteria bacterium]